MRDDLRLMPLWLGLGVVLVLSVWYLSLTSAPPVAGVAGSDKLGHLLAYGVQALWFSWLVTPANRRWVALGFLLQGMLLEFLQGWVGLRTPEWGDAVANSVGVGIGAVLGFLLADGLAVFERVVVSRLIAGRPEER